MVYLFHRRSFYIYPYRDTHLLFGVHFEHEREDIRSQRISRLKLWLTKGECFCGLYELVELSTALLAI